MGLLLKILRNFWYIDSHKKKRPQHREPVAKMKTNRRVIARTEHNIKDGEQDMNSLMPLLQTYLKVSLNPELLTQTGSALSATCARSRDTFRLIWYFRDSGVRVVLEIYRVLGLGGLGTTLEG